MTSNFKLFENPDIDRINKDVFEGKMYNSLAKQLIDLLVAQGVQTPDYILDLSTAEEFLKLVRELKEEEQQHFNEL